MSSAITARKPTAKASLFPSDKKDFMKKLLQRLTETPGPSGYEEAVRDLIRGEVEHLADEVRVDALGSLIVHKAPSAAKRGGKRIMIAAHMDEMGLMASHLDEAGFIRFVSPRRRPAALFAGEPRRLPERGAGAGGLGSGGRRGGGSCGR